MLNTLKQFPYLGITEKIFEKVPKEYLTDDIYKTSSPKDYGINKCKKHKKKKK